MVTGASPRNNISHLSLWDDGKNNNEKRVHDAMCWLPNKWVHCKSGRHWWSLTSSVYSKENWKFWSRIHRNEICLHTALWMISEHWWAMKFMNNDHQMPLIYSNWKKGSKRLSLSSIRGTEQRLWAKPSRQWQYTSNGTRLPLLNIKRGHWPAGLRHTGDESAVRIRAFTCSEPVVHGETSDDEATKHRRPATKRRLENSQSKKDRAYMHMAMVNSIASTDNARIKRLVIFSPETHAMMTGFGIWDPASKSKSLFYKIWMDKVGEGVLLIT